MPLRDWGVGRLALSWITYWLALLVALVVVATLKLRTLRAEQPPGDQLSTIGFSIGLGRVWLLLLLAGPPLALLAAWLWARRQ